MRFILLFLALALSLPAANRYWVGGGSSANWNATAPTNWGTASNTQDGASVPGAADDVFFDGVGTGASDSTMSANITINSLDMNGYANVLTHNNNTTITIDNANGSSISLRFAAGMTYTRGGTNANISFTGTSGGNVTFASKSFGGITFNGTGAASWQAQDGCTVVNGAVFTLTDGVLDLNGQTFTLAVFASTGAASRTLTLGAAAITLNGTSATNLWDVSSSLTLTASTATITISSSGDRTFSGAGLTYNRVDITGPTITLAGANTITNLNITPTAAGSTNIISAANVITNFTFSNGAQKDTVLSLSANQTISGTFNFTGNSVINRLYVMSDTPGTARTITNTGATETWQHVDFRDITMSQAFDASAITGGSGDCGGNSGITFTTGATQSWVGGTGSWSTAAEWSGRTPLCQDDVVFDSGSFSAGSQTATLDMPRAGKSINWTGVTNTPAWAKTTTSSIFGSLTMVSGMTNSGTVAITFEGRSTYTLNGGGITFTNPILINAPGGTLTLAATFVSSSTCNLTRGTLAGSTLDFTCTAFNSSNSNVRTLNMGSGTWTMNSTGNAWTLATATNLTFSANTATLVISNTSATAKTFAGGSQTAYNVVTFSGDNITVTGSNTFGTFNLNTAGLTNGLLLTAGTTQTMTTFASNGSAGNLAKMVSSAGGSAATVSKASGTVSEDYMSLQDSTATGGASWYAGANSTNVSGNTGWTFTAPPGGGVSRRRIIN